MKRTFQPKNRQEKKENKRGFEKSLNSNAFAISCPVSLRWLICGILVVPPYCSKSQRKLWPTRIPS